MAEVGPENCATYDVIKKGAEDGTLLVMDVRSPSELESGKINAKRWVNVPIAEVEDAFKLPVDKFKEKYNYNGEMPASDGSDFIINCGSGRRSEKALAILIGMGYSKARHYPGGYGRWKTEEAEAQQKR